MFVLVAIAALVFTAAMSFMVFQPIDVLVGFVTATHLALVRSRCIVWQKKKYAAGFKIQFMQLFFFLPTPLLFSEI
jgi:hypothetical protein